MCMTGLGLNHKKGYVEKIKGVGPCTNKSARPNQTSPKEIPRGILKKINDYWVFLRPHK